MKYCLILLLCIGCDQYSTATTQSGGQVLVKELKYKGHSYIQFHMDGNVVHDPDCPKCKGEK